VNPKCFRLTNEERAAIAAQAQAWDCSETVVVRYCVRQGLGLDVGPITADVLDSDRLNDLPNDGQPDAGVARGAASGKLGGDE